MTFEAAVERTERADHHRRDREFVAAGDEYTGAAHEYFGDEKPHHALERLVRAIICYRLADEVTAQKRRFCRSMGVEYCRYRALEDADESRQSESYLAARPGAWREFAGDVLLANGEPAYSDEYDAAAELYRGPSDVDLSIIENEHIRLFDIYRSIVLAVGRSEYYERVQKMELHYNEGTLTDWVEFKRETLPACIESLTEEREWVWESDEPDR